MKRAVGAVLLIGVASAVGWFCAEPLCGSPAFRDLAGRTFGRGELLALVDTAGIYKADQVRASDDVHSLVVAERLRRLASAERIDEGAIDREFNLLRFQFSDEKAFNETLRASGMSPERLRNSVAEQVRSRQWIERKIAPVLQVTEQECRNFYETKREEFVVPERWHLRHIFLAAHAATPPDMVTAKGKQIVVLAARLKKGEDFGALATEASEDQATKSIGGDLGWLGTARVPREFVSEIQKLAIGQVSAPFRSHLGFHIAQLIEARPANEISFAEARAEIAATIGNAKRVEAVAQLRESLGTAEFLRNSP